MWESRISRAEQLAAQFPAAPELLVFYSSLLSAQQEIYECLRRRKDWLPSGALEIDLSALSVLLSRLLKTIKTSGPETLATEAQRLSQAGERETDQLLLDYWRAP